MTPKPPSGTWIGIPQSPRKPVARTLANAPLEILRQYASSKPLHRLTPPKPQSEELSPR
jgi:hypothetical protein